MGVGRREVPVDPGAGPVQRFAFELRKLRSDAGGITYRVLAQRAGYSITALSQAAGGEHLPTLPVVLAYVQACGGDPVVWEARWKQAVDEAAASGSQNEGCGEPPYRGLARFEPGDADRFFGRDKLTTDILALVGRRRFSAVTGASGSGKSSLLRAGLIPALQRTQDVALRPAAIRILTPGQLPARTHAQAFDTGPATDEARADVFVIVDQFEEVFTLCHDPAERTAFIEMLLTARQPENRLRVLLAMRADFYGRCTEHPDLSEALNDANLLVGPMRPAELREAIVKPAVAEGLTVERALTARLLDDIADAPGGLPLLSHVLLETWRRRRGKTLTLAGYEAVGGLDGAIAKTAEEVYAGFTEHQAHAARLVLLRLVSPGDGTPDTRRPAELTELQDIGGEETTQVLEALTRARLLTLDYNTVDLAHETLLTAWPRLRGWLEQDRERLRVHRNLTEAARSWEDTGRDAGALYRGTRLDTAQEHFGSGHATDLTGLESAFLTTSLEFRDRERRSTARAARRVRRLRAGLSALAVLVLLVGVIAWRQSEAEEQERLRTEARRVAALAESLRVTDPASAMRLSIAAWNLVDLPETRSALMGAAVQKEQDAFTDPNSDPGAVRYLSADGRTLISAGVDQVTAWDVRTHRRTASFPGLGSRLTELGTLSPDARAVTLIREDGSVQMWDVRAGRAAGPSMPADDGGEISPGGNILVLYRTAGPQAVVQLRDVRTGRVVLEHREQDRLPDVQPGQLSDIPDFVMRRLLRQRRMTSYPLPDVQVSSDDSLMALCLPGARLQVWNIIRQERVPTTWAPPATAKNCAEEDFQFTADNQRLVLRGAAGVRTWDIASGRELPMIRHDGLRDVVFSPDGAFMAAVDVDEILLWRTSSPKAPVFRYSLADEVVSDLRLDTEERRIRYFAGRSQTVVRSLALEGVLNADWQSPTAVAASFSPDAGTLAIAHQETRTGHAHIQLRDRRSGRPVADLPSAPCPSRDTAARAPMPCTVHMAFRPDGGLLAYGVSDPTASIPPEKVFLWDVTARRAAGSVTVTRHGSKIPGTYGNSVNGIVFHPDGRTLLTSRIPEEEAIEYWDTRRGTRTREIPAIGGETLVIKPDGRLLATSHGQFMDLQTRTVTRRTLTTGDTTALAYSPDGRYLASGDESGGVTIWDGDARRPIGELPQPPAHNGQPRYVSALAFSPDGRTLAAGGMDGTLRLWDVGSGRQVGSALPVGDTAVLALGFNADSTTLYSSGANVPLHTYGVTAEHAAAQACKRVGTGLARDQWRTYIREASYRKTC
ncbi:hypothetical protein [Streptomyces sp. TLI_146]|uniref:nSTAND1 domain-containing NTPase n=1 Tax=Streptomyces sp. TLI_146 TaxID=1938858 RepID=UPI000CAE23C8|nr:hypothetical protein [Streptomyces sp. TLI_146]PKV83062.1 WD40 repeat protein [Streptomyces sp. TLI_146]